MWDLGEISQGDFATRRELRAVRGPSFGRLTFVRWAAPNWRRTVMSWVKRLLVVLIAAFVVFYLFTRPEAAADAVKTFFGAFEAIGRFFTSLAD